MENINKVFNVLYLEDDLNINPSEISLDDKSVIRLVIARTCEEALFYDLCKHGKWHKIQNGNRAGKAQGGLLPIIAY